MDASREAGAGTVLVDPPAAAVPSSRRSARPVPEPSPEFAHLSLGELRAARKMLTDEENQVSYWRRIIQARLDVVRTGSPTGADRPNLRPLLSDARVASSRQAVLDVVAVEDVPPLPSLAELWDRQVAAEDTAGLALLEHDLAEAEQQLSAYRKALHTRIDDSTGELIARYRESPSLCLSVLPLGPARTATG